MRILIVTGIYPPQIGGPAQYAKQLADTFRADGHYVLIVTYRLERYLPSGVRHMLFFFRMLATLSRVDVIIGLDTFSTGLPAILASQLFRKKMVIRTGGDFLWESYVERTGDMVLLRKFYKEALTKLNLRERLIFSLTGYVLRASSVVVFSTKWQFDIFISAYGLRKEKCAVIENFYGEMLVADKPTTKKFLSSSRPFRGKNQDRLFEAFRTVSCGDVDVQLDAVAVPHEEFVKKLRSAYAIVVVSISDISPNVILESIRYGKPFIVTRETGISDRIKDIALFVDPESVDDIAEKIRLLCDPNVYRDYENKVRHFSYRHTWKQIADEFVSVIRNIK